MWNLPSKLLNRRVLRLKENKTTKIGAKNKLYKLTVALGRWHVGTRLVFQNEPRIVGAALCFAGGIAAVARSPAVTEGERGALKRAGHRFSFRMFPEHAVQSRVSGDTETNVVQGSLIFAERFKWRKKRKHSSCVVIKFEIATYFLCTEGHWGACYELPCIDNNFQI